MCLCVCECAIFLLREHKTERSCVDITGFIITELSNIILKNGSILIGQTVGHSDI